MTQAATKLQPELSFAPGARIEVRDEEWIVRNCEPIGGGHHAITCTGVSELVSGHDAVFLTSIEDAIRPILVEDTELVSDTSPQYRSSRLYLESSLRRTPPTDNRLYIGHKGVMEPSGYQRVPASLALGALRPRILIADGVGLGKTIEAGILLSELIARGRGSRILVVVMKSMLAQFQKELWTRFTIPLVRLDSIGIKRVEHKIPTGKNPFHYYKRAIISIDTLKNDRLWAAWLEKCHWDAVVIDECHNVVNFGTGRNRVARLLSRTSDAMILTSATPHNGKPESFANLMNMLDPTAISDPLKYAADDIRGLYVRRFKKHIENEVGQYFPKRQDEIAWCKANQKEEAVFATITDATFHTLNRKVKLTKKGRARDVLFKTTLLKAYLSSPWALLETVEARTKSLKTKIAEGGPRRKELHEDLVTLDGIKDAATKIDTKDFSKLNELFDVILPSLKVVGKSDDPRVVVFSERIATLHLLEEQFEKRFGITANRDEPGTAPLAVIFGSESDGKLQDILESFGSRDGAIRVLLASDMASEGINLHHFCSRMVHFDVPWSFIRMEQRNGRIDRFGQTDTPIIRYMLNRSETGAKGDIHVLETLINKEKHAIKNLGDEGTLYNLWDPDREEEATASVISSDKDLDTAVEEIKNEAGEDLETEGDSWFFENLFEHADVAKNQTPELAERASLFSSDLDYLDLAFKEIGPKLKQGKEDLAADFNPQRPEVTFRVPSDLRQRFEQIPREARPKDGKLYLSSESTAVEAAIVASREKKGEWPELQYLWPQHPVMEWLNDRVLVGFGRHQAPVLITEKLDAVDAICLMHGTLANRRGQPVISSWFGLPTKLGKKIDVLGPISLEETLEKTGLLTKLPNPKTESELHKRLLDSKTLWRDAAAIYMAKLRDQRKQSLKDVLAEQSKRLSQWEARTLEHLEERKAKLPAGAKGTLMARHRLAIEDEEEEVRRRKRNRQNWLNNTFTTDDRAHLELAAVFVSH